MLPIGCKNIQLLLSTEIIPVYININIKHRNKLRGYNVEFMSVKPGNRWTQQVKLAQARIR
jgi:hypothetical protein